MGCDIIGHTLNVALMVAAVFVPIILGYTLWIYFKMFGRIDAIISKEQTFVVLKEGLYVVFCMDPGVLLATVWHY